MLFEFIMELLFELAAEGVVEASKSPKLPKLIRYILISIIIIFYICCIALFAWIGIDLLKNRNIIGGSIVSIFASIFLLMSIMAFRKVYLRNNI